MSGGRWTPGHDSLDRPMDALIIDGEVVAVIRHADPEMPFPMHHYGCTRCSDNLSSAQPLRSLKSYARRHQVDAHAVE